MRTGISAETRVPGLFSIKLPNHILMARSGVSNRQSQIRVEGEVYFWQPSLGFRELAVGNQLNPLAADEVFDAG